MLRLVGCLLILIMFLILLLWEKWVFSQLRGWFHF